MSLDEWIETIRPSLTNLDLMDSHVSGSAATFKGIVLDDVQPPAGISLYIRDVGTKYARYDVVLKTGISPDFIELALGNELKTLRFALGSEQGGFSSVSIMGPARPYDVWPIEIEPSGVKSALPDNLQLSSGRFSIKPIDAPTHLFLEDVRLEAASQGGEYSIIEVQGDCSLPERVTISQLRIHPDTALTLPSTTSVTEILSGTGEELGFKLRGTYSGPLPPGTQVTLVDNAALAVPENTRMVRVAVAGGGKVVIAGEMVDCSCVPAAGQHLTVSVRGSAEGLSGDVWLDARDGALLIGASDDPVRVRRIVSLGKAEVENVSLYHLESLSNLPELKNLARFSLWLPADRREARRRAKEMDLGSGSEDTKKQQRAHFWASLTDILRDSHATGRIQSSSRFNAMHFRRLHIKRGSEKSLLSMYSLIGYGESILRPLLVILFLCALFTPWLASPPLTEACCPNLKAYGYEFASLLIAPLAFFRASIAQPDGVSHLGERIMLVTFQLVSLLMLFFALSAIRRITKAE